MATAQQVIDASLVRYKDVEEDAFDDTELLVYLNKGVAHAHNILVRHGSELAATTGTVAGQTSTQEYALESNFLAMVKDGVWTTGANPMTPISYADKVVIGTGTGTPTRYYLTAANIGFTPIPSTTMTIYIYYYTTPTTLLVGTTMPYGGRFNDALSMFMTSMAFSRDELDTSVINEMHNMLERAVLDVVDRRIPVKAGLRKPYSSRTE